MTDAVLTRTFPIRLAPAEVEDGRIVEGRCVPYGVESTVQDHPDQEPYLEVFAPGAFARAVRAPNRVHFRFRHGEGLTDHLGRAVSFTESEDELTGAFRVTASSLGDHALALIDDGTVTGLSVGFTSLSRREKRTASGAIIRDRCHLVEVSLVPEPAYVGASITGRRQAPIPFAAVLDPERDAQLERLRAVGIVIR